MDEESMAQAFTMMAEGTEAAGAAVELVTVPANLACPDCGFRGETTDLLATSADSGVDAGQKLKAALTEAGGRGGGTARMAQGSVPDAALLDRLVEIL